MVLPRGRAPGGVGLRSESRKRESSPTLVGCRWQIPGLGGYRTCVRRYQSGVTGSRASVMPFRAPSTSGHGIRDTARLDALSPTNYGIDGFPNGHAFRIHERIVSRTGASISARPAVTHEVIRASWPGSDEG